MLPTDHEKASPEAGEDDKDEGAEATGDVVAGKPER